MNNKTIWTTALLLTLGLTAFTYISTEAISVDTVMRDQWRFMPMVDHYYSGQLDVDDLLKSHSNHIKVGYKLVFLATATLFKLDMSKERLFGILSLAALCLLMFHNMLAGSLGRRPWVLMGTYFAILLLSFSTVRWNYFQYSLLSVTSFTGWMIFLGFWLAGERYCRSTVKPGRAYLALAFLLLALAVFGFGGGRSPALILVTALGFGAFAWLEPGPRRRSLTFLAVLLAAALACETGYWALVGHYAKETDVGAGYHSVLADPAGALVFGLRALTASVLHSEWLNWLTPGAETAIGGGILLLHLLALVLYIRIKGWRESLVPLMLMLYGGCFVAELIIARFGLGFDNATAPRYVAETLMGLLGCVWIFGMWISRLSEFNGKHALRLTGVLVTAVAALQLVNYHYAGQMQRAEKKKFVQQVAYLRQGDYADLAAWYCPSPELCRSGDAILRRYGLEPYRNK